MRNRALRRGFKLLDLLVSFVRRATFSCFLFMAFDLERRVQALYDVAQGREPDTSHSPQDSSSIDARSGDQIALGANPKRVKLDQTSRDGEQDTSATQTLGDRSGSPIPEAKARPSKPPVTLHSQWRRSLERVHESSQQEWQRLRELSKSMGGIECYRECIEAAMRNCDDADIN